MVLPVLWLLLAALALALGYTTGASAFLWVAYLMLFAWLAGLALARFASRNLTAHRELSVDRTPYGGQVEVEVTVTNSAALPVLWLVASESLPAGLPITGLRGRVGPLAGRSSFSFRYTLHGARRGYYQLGPVALRTGDVFGLSQRERAAAGLSAVTVFPKVLPITHARFPSRRPAGEVRARQRVLEDPTQIVGIRPYHHGDGLRRVHWRATAHTGRLQSKLYEISSQVENVIVLSLRRADYAGSPADAGEAAELGVIAAASIARHILDRRQRAGLLALGRDAAGISAGGIIRVKADRDRAQFTRILSALGRIELGPAEDLAPLLEREKEEMNWGALVVIVTPDLPPEAVSSVLGLRNSGFEVRIVLTGRRGAPAEAAGLQAFGVPATAIRSEADISGLGI
jgi:uncharacterized protein (DUF58 family)